MLQTACTTVELHELPSRESIVSPHQTIATPVGTIFLQYHCPPSLVESLRADSGLRAFARLPEREHALHLGMARQLLALVFEQEALEHHIILGMGLSWHWDTEGLGINRFRYRELVKQLFAPYGFVEYLTSEANIRMDPANILLVRLGRAVDQETFNHFFHRLLQSDTLPGL